MSDLDAIWALFDQLRTIRNHRVHLRALPPDLDLAPSQGGEVTKKLRDCFTHADKFHRWPQPEHFTPKPIVDFVAKVAKRIQPASVLDPVCGYGLLLRGAAEAAGAETVHGVEINAEVAKAASIVLGEQPTLIHGDAFAPHEELLGQYDLIVADPPLRAKLRQEQASAIDLKSRSLDITDGLLVWAASRLNPSGVALVTVTPAFFFSHKSKQVYKAIQNAGSRLSAAIHIPGGMWPETSIASYLLIVEPGGQEDIFVGQLSPDSAHQEQLLANLMRRKPKGSPSLGRICPLSGFLGYDAFVAQENLSRLARDCGWIKYATTEVFPQHAIMREEGNREELTEDAESFFFKLVGKGRAGTRKDELRTGKSQKLREVLHLKVDPEIADPVFMVYWFNESRIGRLSLDALRGGEYIPRIRAANLLRSSVYLPPISDQRLVAEGAAYLRKIRAEADELESALSSGTESAEDLVGRIHSINQEDHYEDWIETLPFPLASILWRHRASKGSYRHRYEVLLHFFEATAAFLATIHLSAFMSDEGAWEKYGKSLHEKLATQKLSLDRATFGAWKLIAERLSSACSSIVKKTEHEGLWQRIYGTRDRRVVEMLSDSGTLGILQQANKIRNDWQGHSGAISEDTAKSVHDQLSDLVQQLRGVFGRHWQRYELIQPGDGRYLQGVHYVTCKRLMGTRSAPFEERVYESEHPLEAESLYLFDSVNQIGMQTRPFIEVIPSPEKQAVACFIFNRLEKEGARWVSYHFEQESEISHASQGVDDALAMLNKFKEVGE